MKVKAKHSFMHDAISPKRGDEFDVNDSLAHELEKRGLVEIVKAKMTEKPENKMAPDPKNKSKAK